MPEWIHERAKHILAKNPDMPKSMAFGVATQQSHALGKSPKSYGTREGRRNAKRKFKKPTQMTRTANPGKLKTEKLAEVGSLTPAQSVPMDYPLLPRGARHAHNLEDALRGEVLPDDHPYADEFSQHARNSVDLKGTGVGFSLGTLGTMLAPAVMDAKRHPLATLGVQLGAPILGAGAGYLMRDRAIRNEGERELPGAQHKWMARTMRKALSDRQDLGKNVDYEIEDQPGMSVGRLRAREGADATKYPNLDYQFKVAFVEALPVITGLASGYGPGRNIAGETAAATAPRGRVQRSENIARNAAVIGVPLGGLAAMAIAHRYKLAPRMADFAAKHFPEGLIADKDSERELIRQLLPGAAAIGGSLMGGAATGGIVGGLQQLRGPHHPHQEKSAALKPSPMWSRIGGASSKKPVWMAQSGFTPTGFKTPAQRLSKSMDTGAFNSSKGLHPLDLGKMQQSVTQTAENMKMGMVMLAITKAATGQKVPVRSEREDAETGDETEPGIAKAADDGGQGGFSTNQYSGVMNPPTLPYRSGIPPWQEPPVKTIGKQEMPDYTKEGGVFEDAEELAAREREQSSGVRIPSSVAGLADDALILGRRLTGKDDQQKTAAGITPAGRLNSASAIGAPKMTAAPGPSISQIAKPKGFGMPMSGAKKGNHII
jgi:hypothetical protein